MTVFNHVFTQSVFKKLFDNPSSPNAYYSVTKRFIDNPYDKNNGQIISEIYSHLKKNQRNEYFYKNTLLNNLLLGIHKPTTTTALTEIPIGKSKADFILINGKAVVYEIKTALDTFERLETQLSDYYKAFDHVSILTDVKNKHIVDKMFSDTPVGICIMTKRNQISTLKKPTRCTDFLDANEIFKVMNKNEYENLLLEFYSSLPDVAPVYYYKECKKMFCDIDISKSYPIFLKQLKRRNKIVTEKYATVPYELKSLVYFSRYTNADYEKLYTFLNDSYRG